MIKLQEFEIEFIEHIGLSMQAEGLPKIAGQIFGLLILNEKPISFSVVTETLQVSRASVSTNSRLLETFGALERVSVIGERQAHFKLPKNPYTLIVESYTNRMISHLDTIEGSVERAPVGSFVKKRMLDHQKFYKSAVNNSQVLIEKLKNIK